MFGWAIRWMMLWRTLAAFAILSAAPAVAHQVPAPIYPSHICVRVAAQPQDPIQLLDNSAAFDCSHSPIGKTGAVTWGLIDHLDLLNTSHDPWEVRHEYSQAKSEVIYVRFADGRTLQASSDRRSARRLFSPGLASFALPAVSGRITAILIRIDGLQNQHGIAPGLTLATGDAAVQSDLPVLFLYALMLGMMLSLLVYNFALWVALRYRFILCYCLSGVSIIGLGLCWSGGIFLVVPSMDTTEQVSWAMFGTMATLFSAALFMASFIERDRLPRRWAAFALVNAAVGVGSCVVRIVDVDFAWKAVDGVTYGSIVVVLATMLATALIAARRGSQSARIYLYAWSLPLALCMARAIWGLGFFGETSVLVAMSPLILMVLESVMSALAVSWQVGRLRTERDEARAKQAELRTLSETDALTGLLNRRAFIDHARSGAYANAVQQLVLADIDQFKLVNDRYGHQAGDEMLIAVAAALRDAAPAGAMIGRLGGEEFAVLMTANPLDDVAGHLCKTVADARTEDGLSVTISAGVADGRITGEADWRLLYYAADLAMYQSKNSGRNRVSHAPLTLVA